MDPPTRWEANDCKRGVSRAAYKSKARRIYRHPSRVTTKERRRLLRMRECAWTDHRAETMLSYSIGLRTWRSSYAGHWFLAWKRLPAWTHTWARRITACESGWRQVAPEGGFLSYFQWTWGTWRAAGGIGNPETVPWREQAVLAVRWMLRHGTMHWPACSQKLGYA